MKNTLGFVKGSQRLLRSQHPSNYATWEPRAHQQFWKLRIISVALVLT